MVFCVLDYFTTILYYKTIYNEMSNFLFLDDALKLTYNFNSFDILNSYTYTYPNDDSDLFYSDVIDEYNYDDITLDYMFDKIPKVIRILDKEYRLHIKFTIFNTWRVKYVDFDEIDSCFEEEGNDLLELLKKNR
jgi:hypothetical protein